MKLEEMRKIAEKRTKGEWKVLPPEGKYYGTEVEIPRLANSSEFQTINLWNDFKCDMRTDISPNVLKNYKDVEECIDDYLGWNHCQNKFDLGNAEFIAMAANEFDKLLAVVEAARRITTPSNLTADTARRYELERDVFYIRTALEELEKE